MEKVFKVPMHEFIIDKAECNPEFHSLWIPPLSLPPPRATTSPSCGGAN